MRIKYICILLLTAIAFFGCRDINDRPKGQGSAAATATRFQDLNYIYFDGQKIDGDFKATDVDGNETDLKTIFQKSRIALRIKEEHCSSCVDFMLKHLNEHAEGGNTAVVLYTHSSRRTLKLKWLDEKLKLPLFLVERNFDEMFKGGEAFKPFVFVLGVDMRVSCFHFPEEGNDDSMKQYLNSVISRILKGSL